MFLQYANVAIEILHADQRTSGADPPSAGRCRISDGTRVLTLPTEDARWCEEYAARFATRRARLEELCQRRQIAFTALRTGDDLREILRADRFAMALRTRARKGARA